MKRSLAFCGLLCLAGSSFGIYGTGSLDASEFSYVGMSGAVIGPNWVITAKHVGGMGFTLNGSYYAADARYDNPTADISLLHFAKAFAGWYSPYYGDPTGKVLTYVGYGLTAEARTAANSANPNTGYHVLDGTGGVKRKMTNIAGGFDIVDYDWGPAWLTKSIVADLDYSTPDAPASSQVDTLGDGGATDNEGGIMFGDSGSSALLFVDGQWRVVGVNIAIDDRNGPNPGGNDNYSDFGDVFYSAWVGEYQNWIDTTMAVPEPTTIALLGLGIAAAVRRRRRK